MVDDRTLATLIAMRDNYTLSQFHGRKLYYVSAGSGGIHWTKNEKWASKMSMSEAVRLRSRLKGSGHVFMEIAETNRAKATTMPMVDKDLENLREHSSRARDHGPALDMQPWSNIRYPQTSFHPSTSLRQKISAIGEVTGLKSVQATITQPAGV